MFDPNQSLVMSLGVLGEEGQEIYDHAYRMNVSEYDVAVKLGKKIL